MNATEFPPQGESFSPEKKQRRFLPLLLIFVAVIAQLAVIFGIERLNPVEYGFIRYFSILPVVSVAYFYGVTLGLYVATFFSLIFIAEVFWFIDQFGYTITIFELVALILFLEILALVVGDLTN